MQTKHTKNFKIIPIIVKIDRLAAWILLSVILLYAISGFGMTKGIIDRDIAASLHLEWLGIIGLIAFCTHTSWAVHLTFRRWKIWNLYSKIFLVGVYILLIVILSYLQLSYKSNTSSEEYEISESINTQTMETNSSATPAKTTTNNMNNNTVFTTETLRTYNGLNNQPSYVAVDGTVYDVSSVFRNGMHQGYQAGNDLSAEFHSQHYEALLERFTIVGTLQKN